jgi:PPM family protein phosphatase
MPGDSRALKVGVGHHTEAGRRQNNQDAILIEALPGDRELFAVADGMGGHKGGQVASRTALNVLGTAVRGGAGLREAVAEANAAVFDAAARDPDLDGMGTTLVAVLRTGAFYEVANVGDSRAYRVDPPSGEVRRLTTDHSFAVEAVGSGSLSEEEAARSPWRRALTRAVGMDRQVEPDVFGPYDAAAPHVVVLCSDGLYEGLEERALGAGLLRTAELSVIARSLVADAYESGSRDNISVVILAFGGARFTDAPARPAIVEQQAARETTEPADDMASRRGRPAVIVAPWAGRRHSRWRDRNPLIVLNISISLAVLGAVLGLIIVLVLVG